MSKLSRRETLTRGGQAVAAAAVLSTLPSIAHAKEDAELFAFFEKCKQLETEHVEAVKKHDETCFAVRDRFPEPPTYRELWQRIKAPGTPEREAVLHRPGALLEALNYVERDVRDKWRADKAEAEKQAGIPALKKKDAATFKVWLAAQDRFFDMPAHTLEGMILKLTIEWNDRIWRHWRAKGRGADVEIHPDAPSSVLIDLERLADQQRAI